MNFLVNNDCGFILLADELNTEKSSSLNHFGNITDGAFMPKFLFPNEPLRKALPSFLCVPVSYKFICMSQFSIYSDFHYNASELVAL